MAVCQQTGQRLADEIALPDDDAADLAFDGPCAFGEGLGSESLGGIERGWRFHAASGAASTGDALVGRIERAEVVAHVVLDRERHIAAVE